MPRTTNRELRRAALLIAAMVLVATAARPASAGFHVWTSAGPEGAGVNALASAIIGFNPLPAEMDLVQPRDGEPANVLFVMPVVYAGTAGKGVFRSVDNGTSWQPANRGIEHTYIESLLVDPAQPATIYAASPNRGVFRSRDGGQSWEVANDGLASASAHLLAAHVDSATLYVTSSDGLYASDDGGDTWVATTLRTRRDDRAISDLSLSAWIDCLGVNPNGGAIYACYFDWEGSPGPAWQLRKSADAGDSWEGLTLPVPGGPIAVAVDRFAAETLYVGTYDPLGTRPHVLKSSDGGATWNAFTALPGCDAFCRIRALALDAQPIPTLYAATDSGIYRASTDDMTWTPFNTGIADLRVDSIIADVAYRGVVHAGAPEGAFTIFHPLPMCPGDCDGDGAVRVPELVAMVGVAMNRQTMATCGAADTSGDSRITVDEIVAGVTSALTSCTAQ
jgi:hypothetical protein